MESETGRSEMDFPRPTSPCWKKKSADEGFVANFKDHFDQLVHTSMEQHRICLKKSIRELKEYIRLRRQGMMVKSTKDNNIERDSEAGNEKKSSVPVQETTSL